MQQVTNGSAQAGDMLTFQCGVDRGIIPAQTYHFNLSSQWLKQMGYTLYRKMPVPRQGGLEHKHPDERLRDIDPAQEMGAMVLAVDARLRSATKPMPVVMTPAPAFAPTTSSVRKSIPVATGVLDYFPDAMVAIAKVSRVGNDQHNPGKPLHWDRSKSGDEADAMMRHFLERGKTDTDGCLHTAKVAWRALAMLQKEIEHINANGPTARPMACASCPAK
jgi:hypothetical protein